MRSYYVGEPGPPGGWKIPDDWIEIDLGTVELSSKAVASIVELERLHREEPDACPCRTHRN